MNFSLIFHVWWQKKLSPEVSLMKDNFTGISEKLFLTTGMDVECSAVIKYLLNKNKNSIFHRKVLIFYSVLVSEWELGHFYSCREYFKFGKVGPDVDIKSFWFHTILFVVYLAEGKMYILALTYPQSQHKSHHRQLCFVLTIVEKQVL